MHQPRCTDYELLCRLVGRRAAAKMYKGALRPLLSRTLATNEAEEKLAVAREFMQRVIAEQLHFRPVFEQPSEVEDFLLLHFAGREYEAFSVLFLDAAHRLIVAEDVFRGTLNQASVYPREIVKMSMQLNAAAVILAHNHPTGNAEPSRADEYLTLSIKNALALVDVRVLDHIVVGIQSTTSFSKRGLL